MGLIGKEMGPIVVQAYLLLGEQKMLETPSFITIVVYICWIFSSRYVAALSLSHPSHMP